MDTVLRLTVMVLQVDKPSGKLDESLVKNIALALRSQPDVL